MTEKTRNQLLKDILDASTGGGAVLSVTGDSVDNTDPLRPIVNVDPNILIMLRTRAALGNTVSASGALGPIALLGTGDEALPPPSPQPVVGGNYNGYIEITGLSMISQSGEISIAGSELIIGVDGGGDYRTPHAWLDISADANNNVVGFIFGIEKAGTGTIFFSPRVTGERVSAQNQSTNISGGGFISSLANGDRISVWGASSINCNLTIYDANLGLEMSIPSALK